jgi:hypothetical protein
MTRIPPKAKRRRSLYLLPEVPDGAPTAVKNGIAMRNVCALEGRCPGCGAVGELHADAEHASLFHLVFQHEYECAASDDALLAAAAEGA